MTPRLPLLLLGIALASMGRLLAASATVGIGQSVSFSVENEGDPPFSYQWMKNGQPITAAVGQTYTISSVTAGDAGNYSVLVMNPSGSVMSDLATLTVGSPAGVTTLGGGGRTSGGGGGGGGATGTWFLASLALLAAVRALQARLPAACRRFVRVSGVR